MTIVLQNLDPATTARLSIEAAEHGRSIEEEVCAVLREKYQVPQPVSPADPHPYLKFRALVEKLGGVDDFELPPREPASDPIEFES